MSKTVAQIFSIRLERWGLRGDPYLWDDLEQRFSTVLLPCSPDDFLHEFHRAFEYLTGSGIETEEVIFIKRYDFGGISGGQVYKEFWRETALPMLLERFQDLNRRQTQPRQYFS